MTGYPITLQIAGKPCVIVGGGSVAGRKIGALLDAGADVTLISPTLTPALHTLHQSGTFDWLAEHYSADMLESLRPVLVFAATDSPEVNQHIADTARQSGAWVNVADTATLSDFHNVAIVEQPPLTVSISTDGTAPALLKPIKAHIRESLKPFATLAGWLGNIRESTRQTISTQTERHQFYERIIESDVLALLQAGDVSGAKSRFDALTQEIV